MTRWRAIEMRDGMPAGEPVDAPSADGEEPGTSDATGASVPRHGITVGAIGAIDRGGHRRVEVVVDGWRFEFQVEDADRADLRTRATRGDAAAGPSGPLEIRAIIPGRVAAVSVVEGDEVTAGQALLIVEAMKMQNELKAPRAGRVSRVGVADGSTIEIGDLLVVIS
jgi:biotin carboxyl carrier protein